MSEYLKYFYENYLQQIRMNAELLLYVMFFVAFTVGLLSFMPETFVPLFGRILETTVVLLSAIIILVFLGLVGIFAYKTYDEHQDEKHSRSPFEEEDDE